MLRYAFWRLVQAAVAVFGVMTIVFVIMRLAGDPTLLLVPEGATREHIEALRHELGFDRPILVQYAAYLADVLRLDFGNSVVQRQPAMAILMSRLPYTLELALGALAFALLLGLPAGVAMGGVARHGGRAAAGGRGAHRPEHADLPLGHPPDPRLRRDPGLAAHVGLGHLVGTRFARLRARRALHGDLRAHGPHRGGR